MWWFQLNIGTVCIIKFSFLLRRKLILRYPLTLWLISVRTFIKLWWVGMISALPQYCIMNLYFCIMKVQVLFQELILLMTHYISVFRIQFRTTEVPTAPLFRTSIWFFSIFLVFSAKNILYVFVWGLEFFFGVFHIFCKKYYSFRIRAKSWTKILNSREV